MFSYILVVSKGYILLISICPMLKAGKMKSILLASSAILANLFKKFFNSAKIWRIFAQLYKHFIDCFVLEFSTVDILSRFSYRICIAIQEKENDILYIAR